MHGRLGLATRLVAVGAVCLALALTTTPTASAAPSEHFTFHDEFDSTNPCSPEGPVLEFHDVVDGRVLGVSHGDGLVYYSVQQSLTAVTTVPGTDVSLTVINKGLTSHDVQITDNGDGTLTIRGISPARVALLGPDGRKISQYSGLYRSDALIDHGGTPGDPSDDEFLEILGESLHGNFDDPGICEVARRYLP